MPKQADYGYSEYTPVKQQQFSALVQMHLKICKAAMARHYWLSRRYYYFDLTAGPGRHMETGEPGSPALFLKAATEANVSYYAMLFERQASTCAALRECIGDNPNVSIQDADYTDGLLRYAPFQQSLGLIYCDPSGDRPAFEVLGDASRNRGFERMDILVNLAATNVKRVYGAFHPDRHLADDLALVAKKYWYVREPINQFQWTLLLGTNWDGFPEYKKIGFHRLETPAGQRIFETVNLTTAERREKASAAQATLPFV